MNYEAFDEWLARYLTPLETAWFEQLDDSVVQDVVQRWTNAPDGTVLLELLTMYWRANNA